MLRTTKSYVIGYGPKAELVVKENGMLESLYGKGERAEYPYLINGDVLSFTTHLGKVLEFKLTEEGKLKGVYKDHNWYCVLDRVP